MSEPNAKKNFVWLQKLVNQRTFSISAAEVFLMETGSLGHVLIARALTIRTGIHTSHGASFNVEI